MAMSVTYMTINGVIVHEALAGGGERELTADPLGSLVKIRTSAVNYSYSAEYWPYGEIQAQTGSNPTRWAFVGLLGYMRDLATMFYVRARYYRSSMTRWMTVDPLWPSEAAFLYSDTCPTYCVDPAGSSTQGCTGKVKEACDTACLLFGGVKRCTMYRKTKILHQCLCRKPSKKPPTKGTPRVVKGGNLMELLGCALEVLQHIKSPTPSQKHAACMECCQAASAMGCTVTGAFFGGPVGGTIGYVIGTGFGHLGGCQAICDCAIYDRNCNATGGGGGGGAYYGGGSIVRGEGTSNPKWD